jgi:hypothetical protein
VVGWAAGGLWVDRDATPPQRARATPRVMGVRPQGADGHERRGPQGGGVNVTVPAASHESGVSLPRRRTLLRSWMVLVLALLGALLALMLGAMKGAQSASAISLPDTYLAAQRSASSNVQVSGSTAVGPADGQWRSFSSLTSDGVTSPSPRVTPKTSVVGSMRRSDHGTHLSAQALSSPAAPVVAVVPAAASTGGVPAELGTYTMAGLAVVMGGAILLVRSRPVSPERV